MSNIWNRIIYLLWAPVYDFILERFFERGRRRAIELASLKPNQRVLLSGVGTGQDLALLPGDVRITGIDLSKQMLAKARSKIVSSPGRIFLKEMNAQKLKFSNDSFDVVFMHLILSVVPDPMQCFTEALRVVKPNGQIIVFDKFADETTRTSWPRRLLNLITRLLGTDINRRLSVIVNHTGCRTLLNEPSLMNGMYRIVLLKKQPADG